MEVRTGREWCARTVCIAVSRLAEESATQVELGSKKMPAQRMAARDGSDPEGEGYTFRGKLFGETAALRRGIPPPSLNVLRCVELAAARRQTIPAVNYSFRLQRKKKRLVPGVLIRAKKPSKLSNTSRRQPVQRRRTSAGTGLKDGVLLL